MPRDLQPIEVLVLRALRDSGRRWLSLVDVGEETELAPFQLRGLLASLERDCNYVTRHWIGNSPRWSITTLGEGALRGHAQLGLGFR